MTEDYTATVEKIAEQLDETQDKPLFQIERIVELCGPEFAEFMVENAEIVHSGDGMTVQDGTRKRTLGGVFFYLVRGAIPHALKRQIFPYGATDKKLQQKKRHPSKFPPLTWETRKDDLADFLKEEKGKAEEVNITIKGRPGKIDHRDGVIVVKLEGNIDESQTFPRGIPEPPRDMTTYYVYIGEQQWKKNGGDAFEKDDKQSQNLALIVDGACAFDKELDGIAVFARSLKVRTEKAAKPKPVASKAQSGSEQSANEGDDGDGIPDLTQFPAEVAKKLRPLYGALRMFRKRLADIEALPEDKQSGLKAAQMMLQRTEQQIAALEKTAEKK